METSSSEKILLKPLKITTFKPNLCKNGGRYCTFVPPCYWWLIMKKRGWKLYCSPNPNRRGVRKCNSAKWGPYGLRPKQKPIFFFQKEQSEILNFQKLFILTQYHMFWLGYECFSKLCDAFLLKSVISSQQLCCHTCTIKISPKN